ncbi:MAG: glutamate-5-semialdehyde dehydrogenase, partial [Myxococcota bacterium]
MTATTSTQLAGDIAELTQRARQASRVMAKTTAEQRQRALQSMATAVRDSGPAILEANARDIANAEERVRSGAMSAAMVDRLRLSADRLGGVAAAIEEIAAMPDLVGRIEREETRPNGLQVARMRIPLGVIAMIYESRPNVTTDAAALCIKAGNAVILRGGSEAAHSNRALGRAVADGLRSAGLPEHAAQVVATTDRAAVGLLLARDRDIDLVIPRGGEGLIHYVAETSRIPVIKHYKGVCHVYIDKAAAPDMALSIAENSKAQRTGVCNAAETILVHAGVASD